MWQINPPYKSLPLKANEGFLRRYWRKMRCSQVLCQCWEMLVRWKLVQLWIRTNLLWTSDKSTTRVAAWSSVKTWWRIHGRQHNKAIIISEVPLNLSALNKSYRRVLKTTNRVTPELRWTNSSCLKSLIAYLRKRDSSSEKNLWPSSTATLLWLKTPKDEKTAIELWKT